MLILCWDIFLFACTWALREAEPHRHRQTHQHCDSSGQEVVWVNFVTDIYLVCISTGEYIEDCNSVDHEVDEEQAETKGESVHVFQTVKVPGHQEVEEDDPEDGGARPRAQAHGGTDVRPVNCKVAPETKKNCILAHCKTRCLDLKRISSPTLFDNSPYTSVWLPSILPLRWESPKTSCGPHLALSVPIPSSGVWDQLEEIWALSEVRLRFPKLPKVEKSLTKITKSHHNFWTNKAILMAFEV